jgi:hypothetical protein
MGYAHITGLDLSEEDFAAMKGSLCTLFLGIILPAIFSLARPAAAALGESASTVEGDRAALSAVRHSATPQSGYSVHEFESDATVVREYVSPSGIVFGIAWNGLVHPDLDQLLGSYAGKYHRALQQTPRGLGRRRIQLKTGSLVVEKWGHMRNLQGRAYDPALIPDGVSVDEIR